MPDFHIRNTRWLALRGVAAIAFGILALAWPNLTFIALLALFGAFAFVEGGFSLAAGLNLLVERHSSWIPYVLGGLAGIGIGAVTFLWPGLTALTLVYVIAFWAIVVGVFELMAALELRDQLEGELMLALAGVVSILFGIVTGLYPRSGVLAIIWIIGLYAILAGVIRLYLAYRISKAKDSLGKVFGTSPSR